MEDSPITLILICLQLPTYFLELSTDRNKLEISPPQLMVLKVVDPAFKKKPTAVQPVVSRAS